MTPEDIYSSWGGTKSNLDPHINLKNCQTKGICAFASDLIPKNCVFCFFPGEMLSFEEGNLRENFYGSDIKVKNS